MSFDGMKADELLKIAEAFAVEVEDDHRTNPTLIVAALSEEGVTYDQYVTFMNPPKEEVTPPVSNPEPKTRGRKPVVAAVVVSEKNLLVKMERPNYRFDVAGKTFTKEHPFVLCTEEEAQAIFDTEQGFRPATPREAQEYYS